MDPNAIQQELCRSFDNSPSSAVAIYGLRKCVVPAELDIQKFVNRHFTSIISTDYPDEMVNGSINLHKILSILNSVYDL